MLKGNNITKLLVVLALLIGVFFIVRYTGNSGRSKSFRTELVTLDTAKVTRVEIQSPEGTTELEREGSSWTVNDSRPAESTSVKSLLSTLLTIKPSRIASRSEDTWKDFEVDDSGTRVMVYEGSSKVLDIVLGRFNVEGQRSFYSYVRLAEESDVYVAKDFMKMSVGTTSSDFRKDDILQVKVDSLSSIRFSYPDSGFVLKKANDIWMVDNVVADSAEVAKYLQSLRFLSSRNFVDDPFVTEAFLEVVFETTSNQWKLTSYGQGRLKSSYNEDELWNDTAVENKVFKSRSYFIGD